MTHSCLLLFNIQSWKLTIIMANFQCMLFSLDLFFQQLQQPFVSFFSEQYENLSRSLMRLFRYGMQQKSPTGIQLGTLQLYGMHLYHQATRMSHRSQRCCSILRNGWMETNGCLEWYKNTVMFTKLFFVTLSKFSSKCAKNGSQETDVDQHDVFTHNRN